MAFRHEEPGWKRIGPNHRRSLWVKLSVDKIELCAGREGDDDYVVISQLETTKFNELYNMLSGAAAYVEYYEEAGGSPG